MGHAHMAFAGQHLDSASGSYLLGNGHRAYDPVLMRFRSPDTLSPMGAGGINAYAYCANDPVNRVDPSGRLPWPQTMAMQSSGELVKHYFARLGNAVGSLTGAAMAFAGMAAEYTQLQRDQPGASFPAAHRLRRILGFHALLHPTFADFIELFLSPEAAGRVGVVDNFGLSGSVFFIAEGGVALISTVRTEGFSGLVPTAPSLLYAAGEVTLVNPAREIITHASDWAWNYVYENILSAQGGQRPPAITVEVIRRGA